MLAALLDLAFHCLGRSGFAGRTLLIEAGRGPGGRASSRRHRSDPNWRLDHGAPALNFSAAPQGALAALLQPLLDQGVLVEEQRPLVWLDGEAQRIDGPPQGLSYAGSPAMASLAEALLAQAPERHQSVFGCRLRSLEHSSGRWLLANAERTELFAANVSCSPERCWPIPVRWRCWLGGNRHCAQRCRAALILSWMLLCRRLLALRPVCAGT